MTWRGWLSCALVLAQAPVAVLALHPHSGPSYARYFLQSPPGCWLPADAAPDPIPDEPRPIELAVLTPAAACGLLTGGWSHLEGWGGVWLLGRRATLRVPTPPGTTELVFEVALPPTLHPPQPITVQRGADPSWTTVITGERGMIAVPLPAGWQAPAIDIGLSVKHAVSPFHIHWNQDERQLGLGLLRIQRN